MTSFSGDHAVLDLSPRVCLPQVLKLTTAKILTQIRLKGLFKGAEFQSGLLFEPRQIRLCVLQYFGQYHVKSVVKYPQMYKVLMYTR